MAKLKKKKNNSQPKKKPGEELLKRIERAFSFRHGVTQLKSPKKEIRLFKGQIPFKERRKKMIDVFLNLNLRPRT